MKATSSTSSLNAPLQINVLQSLKHNIITSNRNIPTQNRFNIGDKPLSEFEVEMSVNQNKNKNESKPKNPPIIIANSNASAVQEMCN
jgi:hypothetical protein